VSPKACLTVTDPSSATVPGLSDPQAVANAAALAVIARKLLLDHIAGTRRA
jgi:hypothetical protein